MEEMKTNEIDEENGEREEEKKGGKGEELE